MNTKIFTNNTNPWISEQEYEYIQSKHQNTNKIKQETTKLFTEYNKR